MACTKHKCSRSQRNSSQDFKKVLSPGPLESSSKIFLVEDSFPLPLSGWFYMEHSKPQRKCGRTVFLPPLGLWHHHRLVQVLSRYQGTIFHLEACHPELWSENRRVVCVCLVFFWLLFCLSLLLVSGNWDKPNP